MTQVEFDRFGAEAPRPGAFSELRRQAQGVLSLGAAATSAALIVGLGFWGYDIAVRDATGVPVVRAAVGPMRIAPADPGGDVAAHQGLAVNVVAALGVAQAPAERLVLAPRPRELRADDAPGLAPPMAAEPPAVDAIASVATLLLSSGSVDQGARAGAATAPTTAASTIARNDGVPVARIAGDRTADAARPQWLRPPSTEQAVTAAPAPTLPDREPVVVAAASDDPMGLAFPDVAAAAPMAPQTLPVAMAALTLPPAEIDPDAVNRALADALADGTVASAPAAEEEPIAVASDTPLQVRPRARPALAASTPAADAEGPPDTAGPEVAADTLPVGTHLVQVGAFDDANAARGEWMRLSGRFGDLMTGKARVVQAAESGGRTFFRLRATGFAGTDEARRFCSALRAEGADCIPVELR